MNIKEQLAKYISENLEVSFERVTYDIDISCLHNAKLKTLDEDEMVTLQKNAPFGESFKNAKRSINPSLENYIKENKEDSKFQKLLFKYIDERNLKDSDVYNKVNIDRRLFSKIRNDSNYHPSKETVILLAIALEINEDELLDLLNSAEYSLPNNDIFNLIIKFCFQEKIYNVNTLNEFLYDYNCKTIS